MTITAPSPGAKDTGPSDTGGPGSEVAARDDLITMTIDDVEVSVPKGTLVIRAAELVGVAIPRFCDHPLLDPVGACRQCLVEITDAGNGRGMPKPQASCTIEAADGMVVKTQVSSPVADKAQAGQMEFLLINHPLDCPICDKGGECPLQNQAMTRGRGESRFEGVKRTYPKPINISPQILLDRERCVLCARCTRFSEQIAGDPFIQLVERGALQQVGIYEKEPYESYFSGNTIQICPVGALTSTAYRFRARPFDLVSTPAVSEHDACGSAIRVDHRRGTVMRRLAGDDPEVNEEWITDKDRFAFRYGQLDDRLTRPLVRDGDHLRPASWPEALDVAARGLAQAGSRVGVLTGGRLTVEDAYGYSKFARAVLGTNNIDFRSRPHSAEEAEFLAHAVAGTGRGVTYADLENASSVLLVALEPEEEAGAIFLRLRKAHRKKDLKSWTLAPYLSNGAFKLGATLVPTVPGTEAAVLESLGGSGSGLSAGSGDESGAGSEPGPENASRPRLDSRPGPEATAVDVTLDDRSVILVGERAAGSSGALTAALALSRRTGARLAWVPRRAGDRGAVEAGCLPNLLPGGRPVADPAARVDTATTWGVGSLPPLGGRDADEMLSSAVDQDLAAIVVAGVDPRDLVDPRAALEGLESIGFVVSLETRASLVTERANVVLPVSLIEERAGTFVNWEGRDRSFGVVIERPNTMSDLRVLAALADAMGRDLGVRTPAQARAELSELGFWDGDPAPAPQIGPARLSETTDLSPVLATWRLMIDDSRALDGEPHLLASARRPVARMSAATASAAQVQGSVLLANDRGALSYPLEIVPGMVDGVVWVPTRAPGHGVFEQLAVPAGDVVQVNPGGRLEISAENDVMTYPGVTEGVGG